MNAIVTSIVSRLHVSATNREVCRFIRSKLNPTPRKSKTAKWRERRKAIYRDAIEAHAANRKLFNDSRF